MAIIIDESKIYNYTFNILQNNFINNVYANIENSYNFKDISITIDANINTSDTSSYSASWSVSRKSDFLGGINLITPSRWSFADVVPYTETTGSMSQTTNYRMYHYFQIQVSTPTDLFYIKDTKKIPSSVKIKVTYQDETTEEGEAQVCYTDVEMPPISSSGMGILRFGNFSSNSSDNFGTWFIYAYLPGGIGTGIQPWVWKKAVKKIELLIKCNLYMENLEYVYASYLKSSEGKFSLSNTGMFDQNVGTPSGGIVYNPIYNMIAYNITSKYGKGKMSLEIETRYTTFKDSDGNDVNGGKPYLIQVGDIVKPKMINKFKNFEYEYLVTSVEHEYDGSDKVYLKLIQK